MKSFIIALSLCLVVNIVNGCTVTTVSGSRAPPTGFCAGDLIFEDNFDTLDHSKWTHEVSLAGGGNWEVFIISYLRCYL